MYLNIEKHLDWVTTKLKDTDLPAGKAKSSGKTNVVVLGAGVVGLTTALLLSRDEKYSITIVAKHMPGDIDNRDYASPWAGASYEPCGAAESKAQQYELDTGPELFRLCRDTPEAGIAFQPCRIYFSSRAANVPAGDWYSSAASPDPFFRNVVEDFRLLLASELPEGITHGSRFTTVCVNPAIYLPYLVGQCLRNGASIRRGTVTHIREAAYLHSAAVEADVVVNCTGLSARTLGGVMDRTVYPARGQTVLVRQEPLLMTTVLGLPDCPADEVVYTMTRGAAGGTILGGCKQDNNWDTQVDEAMAVRIMQRAVKVVPELTNGKGAEALDVVSVNVGLRPMREGGPRVEGEVVDGIKVVHNYGHGRGGYQMSYGSAMDAVKVLEGLFEKKAKL